jgi:hypothetical protein
LVLRLQRYCLLRHQPSLGGHVRRARRLAAARGRRGADEPPVDLPRRRRGRLLRQLGGGRARGRLAWPMLVSAAVDVGQESMRGRVVSGLACNALLAEVCTTQCLSNRPDGCA